MAHSSPYPEPIKYFLEPGYLYLATAPALISTVLGSCVSICIWDVKLKFGGMNHFILPKQQANDKASTKFGKVAIPLLIKMMIEEGSTQNNLEAQILGGAKPVENITLRIGEENVAIAREMLKHTGLKVVSEDVGGNLGRKIIFNTFTGEALVVKVKQLRSTDWRIGHEKD